MVTGTLDQIHAIKNETEGPSSDMIEVFTMKIMEPTHKTAACNYMIQRNLFPILYPGKRCRKFYYNSQCNWYMYTKTTFCNLPMAIYINKEMGKRNFNISFSINITDINDTLNCREKKLQWYMGVTNWQLSGKKIIQWNMNHKSFPFDYWS